MDAYVAGAATLVAAGFSASLLRRWHVRGRINRALVYWALSLAMFALASLTLAYGEVAGWSSGWFRVFYLFGGVLVVPWLALGTIQTAVRDRVTLRVLGVTALVVAVLLPVVVGVTVGLEPQLFVPGVVLGVVLALLLIATSAEAAAAGSVAVVATFSAVAAFAVLVGTLRAPVPVAQLPEGSDLFGPGVRGFAVGANALGAALVVVGAATSAIRLRGRGTPHLVLGNLMIGLGVLAAASGGALAFLGETSSHALANAVGVTIMYAGFVRTTRAPRSGAPGERDGERDASERRAGGGSSWR